MARGGGDGLEVFNEPKVFAQSGGGGGGGGGRDAIAQAMMQQRTMNGMDANGTLWQNGVPIGVTPGRDNSRVWNAMDPSVDAPMVDLYQAGAVGNPERYYDVARAYGVGGQTSTGNTGTSGTGATGPGGIGPGGGGSGFSSFDPGGGFTTSNASMSTQAPGTPGQSYSGGNFGTPSSPGAHGVIDPGYSSLVSQGFTPGSGVYTGPPSSSFTPAAWDPGLPQGNFVTNTFGDRFADFGRSGRQASTPSYQPGGPWDPDLPQGDFVGRTGRAPGMPGAPGAPGAPGGFPGGGSYGDFAATAAGYGGGAMGGAGSFGGFGAFGGFDPGGGGWGGFDVGGYSGGYDTAAGNVG